MKLVDGKAVLNPLEAESAEILTLEATPEEVIPGDFRKKIAEAYEQRLAQEPEKIMLWNVARRLLSGLDRLAALN